MSTPANMKFATVFVLACAALAKAATTGNTTVRFPNPLSCDASLTVTPT